MPSPRALVATPYRRGVLAMAVVTLVWRAWTLSRWTWQDDDWVYLARTSSMPLHDYLLQMYNGHFMPGEFLVMWVVTKLAPLDFVLPLVLTSIGCAVAVLLWGRALSGLAGERVWLLLPLALVSLSPLLLRPTMWWASALQVVPLQICLAWGVIVAARMARSPSGRDVLQLAAVLTIALLFWEKSLLLTIPFTCVLLSAHGGLLPARFHTHARSLSGLAGICVVYIAGYLALGRQSGDQREKGINFSSPPSVDETVDFFGSGLGNLLAPSFFGGPWGSMPTVSAAWHEAPTSIAMVSALGLAGVLVTTTMCRRGSWFPLLAGIVYVLVSWALVLFSSRFVNLGTIAINDERYSVDSFSVLVLCVVVAWAREPRNGGPRTQRTPLGWPVRALGQVLAISLVVGNVWAVQRVGTAPAKPWVDTLSEELADVGRVTLFNSPAPAAVLAPSYWLEYATTTRMLSPLRDVSFTEPAERMHLVDQGGHLVPIAVNPDSRSEEGPVRDCGYSVEPGQKVAVPMSQGLFEWNWVLQVDTLAASGGALTIRSGGTSVVLDVEPGLQTLQAPFPGSVGESVDLEMSSAGGTVCVATLIVGNPVTDGAATADAQ